MLTTLLLSFLTLSGLQQADSVSNEWLTNEWQNSFEIEVVGFTPEAQIIIVSIEGDVMHKFAKGTLTERCANCIAAYQKSDFLFSLNEDEYYLMPYSKPTVQPSETVQYSSAE
jgi:hypothetical protein